MSQNSKAIDRSSSPTRLLLWSSGDEVGVPAATVSADSAYISVGMSLWTTGTISVANESAKALGIRVGMSTQEAAALMLAAAKASLPPQ